MIAFFSKSYTTLQTLYDKSFILHGGFKTKKWSNTIGTYLSQCMRFLTMWYVRPAKPQISLRIRAVWSEPLLIAWVFNDCKATDWTPFGVSKLKRRLQRLVWVYTCQNATLLEIPCHGTDFSYTYKTRVKQPLLQAAQDFKEPSGTDFNKISENSTEIG